MKNLELSFNSRKALAVHVGEEAATEIVDFLETVAQRVARLEKGKVDVMPIVPINANAAPTDIPLRRAA